MTKRTKKTTKAKRYRHLPLADKPLENKVIKFRYNETVSINPAVATLSSYIFRANSMADPNYTGTGHQPMGHDQWALFYNHYRVLGSKCTVAVSEATENIPVVCGLMLNDDTTFTADKSTLIEQGRGQYRYVTHDTGTQIMTQKYSAKKFHNASDIKDREDLKATFGNSPDEQAFYIIWAQSQSNLSDPGEVFLTVTIDYICQLEEPKDLLQS